MVSCHFLAQETKYHCERLQYLLLCRSMDWFLYDRDLRHERAIAHQNLPVSLFFARNVYKARDTCSWVEW